jgi:hypothetical protein
MECVDVTWVDSIKMGFMLYTGVNSLSYAGVTHYIRDYLYVMLYT